MRSLHVISLLLFVCLFSLVAVSQQTPVLVKQHVDNSIRTVLAGNVHPLASAEFDRGEVAPDMPLHRMLLVLKRSDQQESALRALIENQQFKKSPDYHQWLTPEEFGLRFGPADADIAAVTNWLKANGFQVAQVSKGRIAIEFSGTAGAVKQAFGAPIHKFIISGETHWANVSNPSIPTALAPVVAGIDSLHNFLKKPHNKYIGTYSEKTQQVTSSAPNFTFNGGCVIDNTGNCYAVTPFDFATIYNLLPLWNAPAPINGTGQTIAIVGRSDINPSDATTFWSLFGLDGTHAPQPTLVITHDGPPPGVTPDESEADIDTQWAGAAAPGATINYVTAATTETTDGVDLSAIHIVDNNLAPVMSESFGLCEQFLGTGGVQFFGALWEEAAAQGISAMVSTGDNGAAGCDDPGLPAQRGLNVSGIASTPFNVAVGGTDFKQFTTPPSTFWNLTNDPVTQASAKGYIPETTWNDSCANPLFQFLTGGSTNPETNCNNPNFVDFVESIGGSGGASAAWLKPSWQTGTGVPKDNRRDLPDVSLFASSGFLGSFYVICQTDITGVCDLNNFLGFGGTSVSSPAFAGIMALVNQKWGVQGNPNFVLYKLPGVTGVVAFHDIIAGSTIAMPCLRGTPNCVTNTAGHQLGILSGFSTTAAYDLATGLGSVDAAQMVNNWNKVTFTPSTTTLTINNGAAVSGIVHGTAIPVSVAVTPTPPATTPPVATGDVSLLVSPQPGTPAIDFNTLGATGSVNWSTNLLPGGTYQVIAHYEGDTRYGGSYSSPSANVTITAENSSVLMPGVVVNVDAAGNPVYSNSVVYGTGAGSAYLLRADVLNAAGSFCTSPVLGEIACPTGSVTFTDNGNPLDGGTGTFKLNSLGYTEDQAIQLTGGSHTLVAKYNGDPSYQPSPNTNAVITVAKATTVLGNLAAPSPDTPGQTFTVSGTVTTNSNGVAPTGTVQFLANGTALPGTVILTPTNGSSTNSASLGATLSTSIATPGIYNITATYSGDGNYTSLTSSALSVSIFDFTIQVADPPAVHPGQSTSTSMLVTPVATTTFTSNVTFSCSGPTGVTCTFNPSQILVGGQATTVTVTVQTAGPFTGTAGAAAPHKLRSHNQRLWFPLSLPLAGVVLLGLGRRKLARRYQVAGLCLALTFTGFLLACGGGSSSPPPPPPVSVSVSPASVNTLFPNLTGAPAQAQQFTATVNNGSSQSVTWAVAGGDTNGTIDATGLYTAPTVLPNPNSPITVTATAAADATKSGRATVNLQVPTSSGTVFLSVTEGGMVKTPSINLTVN